jgi:hypothetical protein
MDRLILALLRAQGRFATMRASGTASPASEADLIEDLCVPQAVLALELDQALQDPISSPDDTLWDLYFSPPAPATALCSDVVVQYAVGYLGFTDALMVAGNLAGAGPLGAVLFGTGSALWFETLAEAVVLPSLPDLVASAQTLVDAPVSHEFITGSGGLLHEIALHNRQLIDSILGFSRSGSGGPLPQIALHNQQLIDSNPGSSLQPQKRSFNKCSIFKKKCRKKIKKPPPQPCFFTPSICRRIGRLTLN